MSWVLYIVGAAVAVGVLLLIWSTAIEPRLFRVRRIFVPAGEVGLPPMRILHITDMHLHGRDQPMLSFLRELAAREQFDLVCYTGDLIHRAGGVRSLAEAAGLFQPRLGSFAVLGGHDYSHIAALPLGRNPLRRGELRDRRRPNPVSKVVEALEKQGVRVLRDENVQLEGPDGAPFALVGLRDAYLFDPDVDAAWHGLSDDIPVVALAHSPDVLPEVSSRCARLALFGHTHGGQVRFPLIGALVTKSKLPRRAARGVFRFAGTVFVVTAGLGQAPDLSLRFLCRPEVAIIELGSFGVATPRLKELHVG